MGRRAQPDGQIKDALNLVEIGTGYGGVDLEFYARFFHGENTCHGPGKGAVYPAKGIVAFCIQAVNADTDPLDTRL